MPFVNTAKICFWWFSCPRHLISLVYTSYINVILLWFFRFSCDYIVLTYRLAWALLVYIYLIFHCLLILLFLLLYSFFMLYIFCTMIGCITLHCICGIILSWNLINQFLFLYHFKYLEMSLIARIEPDVKFCNNL